MAKLKDDQWGPAAQKRFADTRKMLETRQAGSKSKDFSKYLKNMIKLREEHYETGSFRTRYDRGHHQVNQGKEEYGAETDIFRELFGSLEPEKQQQQAEDPVGELMQEQAEMVGDREDIVRRQQAKRQERQEGQFSASALVARSLQSGGLTGGIRPGAGLLTGGI